MSKRIDKVLDAYRRTITPEDFCKQGKKMGDTVTEYEFSHEFLFNIYFEELKALAVNRYKWLNLPKGVYARWIEELLFRNQLVSFTKPIKDKEMYIASQPSINRTINPYGIMKTWNMIITTPYESTNIACSVKNSVLIEPNESYSYDMSKIEYYAHRMAQCDEDFGFNRIQLRTPLIISVPEGMDMDVTKIIKDMYTGRPVVGKYSDLMEKLRAEILVPNVEDRREKHLEVKNMILNEALTYLGIDNANTYKKERLIDDEVEANNDQIAIRRADGLKSRERAVKEINEKFGLNIKCIWNANVNSDNYLSTHDIKVASKEGLLDAKSDSYNEDDTKEGL